MQENNEKTLEFTEKTMETTQKTAKSDENELREHLLGTENAENNGNNTKNSAFNENINVFRCPDFVLDFLQDKPVKIQEFILTKNLNSEQKKKVRDVFRANENELKINRIAIKELIEELGTKYPEIQPYFSNKTIFFGTFTFGFMERKNLVDDILESKAE